MDQVRRSSRLAHANIAETWRKRRYKASFVAKLSDSETEASEMQSWLDLALRLEYITHTEHIALNDRCENVIAQLVLMIDKADQWCTLNAARQ